jgi:hypothetical protein
MLWATAPADDVGIRFALSKPRLPTLPKELCIVLLRLPTGWGVVFGRRECSARERGVPSRIISWGRQEFVIEQEL